MQSGKRRQRQTAALVVQSLWSSNSTSKKKADKAPASNAAAAAAGSNGSISNKNVRPVLEVPPMGFGPIRDPNSNDVLCGRGGLINGSAGNVQFRTIVSTHKKQYNAKTTKRNEKAHLAAEIVRQIRSMEPPGRFLREDANGMWFDIGDARAIRKTGQALREAAPTIRQELEGGGEGEDAAAGKMEATTDSGSDDGSQKDEPEKKAADSRNKDEAKKEAKAKKQSAKKQSAKKAAVQPETTMNVPSSEASVASSTVTTKTKRSSWFSGSRNNNNNNKNNNDAAAEAAPRGFLIPTAALGPHITGSVTSVVPAGTNIPRMSTGPVFSNNRGGLRASAPPVMASDQHSPPPPHHYPPHPHPNDPHAHLYPPYPAYGATMQHHPSMHHHHMPPPHMHPMAPPMHPPSAVYHPSMGGYPQDAYGGGMNMANYNQDAFGMNFYPTHQDVSMDQQSGCTVSDISGLSSSVVTNDPRKQKHPVHMHHHHHHAASSSQRMKQPPPPVEGVPPPMNNNGNDNNNHAVAPGAAMDSSMIDTTSSLPSFSDLLDDDDVDMASAMSGKGSSLAMGSVSSSTMAKFIAPMSTASGNNSSAANDNMMMKPPPSQSSKRNTTAGPPSYSMTMKAPDQPAKENTGSCLSGKSGSCLSGKSELSLPSSCGTNISQFSDTFMALHLSDHHEFE